MKQSDNQKIAEMLYSIRISHERPMDNPDDVTLSIENMLAELRELGYDYHYLSDISLRRNNDKRIMRILMKYYDEMDLYTRDSFMYKIHPKYYPQAVDIATKEFLTIGPSARRELNGFQTAMSKGIASGEYFDKMINLLQDANHYPALSEVRIRLCKSVPEKMFPIVEKYRHGVLIVAAIQDYARLPYRQETAEILSQYASITTEEVKQLVLSDAYPLSVTNYRYWRSISTVDRIRADAKSALRKVMKKQENLSR